MYAKTLVTAFLSILSLVGLSQSRFSVDDSSRNVSGGTSWGILHHSIQLNNHVGDTLDMRWRKTVQFDPPAAWQVTLVVPDTLYPDIALMDSADFSLPDSASNHTHNKIIIGVDPNGALGSGKYFFTLYERQNPSDTLRISFIVNVYTSANADEYSILTEAYPNPANEYLYIPSLTPEAQLSLRDLFGKEVPVNRDAGGGNKLILPDVPAGYYFLKMTQDNEVQVIKISIQH